MSEVTVFKRFCADNYMGGKKEFWRNTARLPHGNSILHALEK